MHPRNAMGLIVHSLCFLTDNVSYSKDIQSTTEFGKFQLNIFKQEQQYIRKGAAKNACFEWSHKLTLVYTGRGRKYQYSLRALRHSCLGDSYESLY